MKVTFTREVDRIVLLQDCGDMGIPRDEWIGMVQYKEPALERKRKVNQFVATPAPCVYFYGATLDEVIEDIKKELEE